MKFLLLLFFCTPCFAQTFSETEVMFERDMIRDHLDRRGRITPKGQEYIYMVEEKFGRLMSPKAKALFQQIVGEVGGKLKGELVPPANTTPYWLREKNNLQNYQSTPQIPDRVDVLIIGAGLTGSSAAYHLSEYAKSGLNVAVIDAGNVGEGASGRNGGNFELMPENFMGKYEYLAHERFEYLKQDYPSVDDNSLWEQAHRQAKAFMQFGQRNAIRILDIVKKNNIEADISRDGWLRIAADEDEVRGFKEDAELAKSIGIEVEILSAEEIKKRFKLDAKFSGRLIKGFGNYHPYKLVSGLMRKAIDNQVKLYTNIKVTEIGTNDPGDVVVKTDRADIRAGRVIVATNAYTREFLPEAEAIMPYQSQIMVLEHVEDHLKGITYTGNQGDQYANIPRGSRYVDKDGVLRGSLLVGGGLDTPIDDPRSAKVNPQIFKDVKKITDAYHPDTVGQPPSASWAGPMGFTTNRLPLIGFLFRNGKEDPRVVIGAGFQGYGGTFAVEAGEIIDSMALTGKYSDRAPKDIFAPENFLKRNKNHFSCPGLFP
jgi:glycine/D-amino acid oxidase-like deaminating enzyme